MSRVAFDQAQGRLLLVGTPIGDAADASDAVRRALSEADVIAAEDTRRFRVLCARIGIEPVGTVVSYFEGNESERTPGLVNDVASGKVVVVATDAGMPSVSDPGYRLVEACIEAGLRVSAVPGPSAVLTALAVSGLPVDRFCFEGFCSRKAGERRRRLASLASEPRTMVFFESPHRLRDFLADAAEAFGEARRGVVCRELTKEHEEIVRAGLGELARWAEGEVRGEVSVVIEGAPPLVADPTQALADVARRTAEGQTLSRAVAHVAREAGMKKKELYDMAIRERNEAK